MSALPDQPPLLRVPASVPVVELVRAEPLVACVQALDAGSRALLDLSLRRRFPLEAMAPILRTDAFDLARRRARAVARIAAELDLEGPGVVAMVRAALAQLPDEAWGVPLPREPVQADRMKVQAAALMEKLRERQRDEAERRASEAAAAVPSPPPARVRGDELIPPEAIERLGLAGAAIEAINAAVSRLEERTVVDADVVEGSAETIEFERVQDVAAVPAEPEVPVEPEPVAPQTLTYVGRPKRGKLARGGILVALIAAILRFLFRR